jgi:hypothetical protein
MRVDNAQFKRWGRWVATFVAFPLAGVAARAAGGDIDAARAAILGGLAGGAVLGAVQGVVGGVTPGERLRWTAGSAVGFALGLTAGGEVVGYRTDVASLVVMGAISGAVVGIAQALVIPMRAVDRVLWIVATPALWAGGWLLTSQVIVDADRHHAMFGTSGALVVSAVAAVLHVRRRPGDATRASVAGRSNGRVFA